MGKAEKFIDDCTRNCSNKLDYVGTTCIAYQPWLTPDQARRAVEIAKEETKKELELTNEDVYDIWRIYNEVCEEGQIFGHDETSEEVLKRFKAKRGRIGCSRN